MNLVRHFRRPNHTKRNVLAAVAGSGVLAALFTRYMLHDVVRYMRIRTM
jgi:hypothetical protein